MAGRILPQRDVNLITRVSRELVGDKQNSKDGIINQTVVVYKPSLQESATNMYGEAAGGKKVYKNGVQMNALIDAEDFDFNSFDEWASEFSKMDNDYVRKAGGAGFFCRVEDYKWIGGNDDLFRPASWEDKDLFIRMQLEGYEFKMIPQSVLWHFSARGSHFRDEAKDDFNKKSERQQKAEQSNMRKWISKWGRLPEEDEATFVKPLRGTGVETKLEWVSYE